MALYAAKIAAVRLALPRDQVAAAEAALRAEERAALDALKREQAARVQAMRAAGREVTRRNFPLPSRPRRRARRFRLPRLRR